MHTENIIFTDGSSRGNPGSGGWAAIIAYNDSESKVESLKSKVIEIGGRENNTTNNRMEMKAVIESLQYLLTTRHLPLTTSLYTDSSYVINGATKWAKGWQENGWKTKAKENVLNKDLWEVLLSLTEKIVIEWKLVEGHAGISANERCDQIATSFADGEKIELYNGLLSGYGVSFEIDKKFEKTKQTKNTKKAYSYVSLVEGKINIDKVWSECEKRVKGKSNVRFKKSFSPEDEQEIIKNFEK